MRTNQIAAFLFHDIIACSSICIFACTTGDQVGEGRADFNISDAYAELNDQDNALVYMKRAHEIFVVCLGDAHPHTVMARERMAALQ